MKLFTLFFVLLLTTSTFAQEIDSAIPNYHPDSRYTNNNDGTITDNSTDLMWTRCTTPINTDNCVGEETTGTWSQSLESSYWQGYTYAVYGLYNDWRLPSLTELRTLVAKDRINPAINENVFPNTREYGNYNYYWTSTPSPSNNEHVFVIDFANGSEYTRAKGYPRHSRLVRDAN